MELVAKAGTAWSQVDEKNWAASRKVLRDLKKRGEAPSEWLAAEHAALDARRMAWKREERRAEQEAKLRAHAEKAVAAMPELTEEQCRRIAAILMGN